MSDGAVSPARLGRGASPSPLATTGNRTQSLSHSRSGGRLKPGAKHTEARRVGSRVRRARVCKVAVCSGKLYRQSRNTQRRGNNKASKASRNIGSFLVELGKCLALTRDHRDQGDTDDSRRLSDAVVPENVSDRSDASRGRREHDPQDIFQRSGRKGFFREEVSSEENSFRRRTSSAEERLQRISSTLGRASSEEEPPLGEELRQEKTFFRGEGSSKGGCCRRAWRA